MKPTELEPLPRLMVRVIQMAIGWDDNDDLIVFEQKYNAVERVAPLLVYLGLARENRTSPIGFLPTSRLVDFVADRIVGRKLKTPRWTKQSDQVLKRLSDAVWGEWAKTGTNGKLLQTWERQLSAEWVGFRTLAALGAVWMNEWEEVRATPALYELLKESGHGDVLLPPSIRQSETTSKFRQSG